MHLSVVTLYLGFLLPLPYQKQSQTHGYLILGGGLIGVKNDKKTFIRVTKRWPRSLIRGGFLIGVLAKQTSEAQREKGGQGFRARYKKQRRHFFVRGTT